MNYSVMTVNFEPPKPFGSPNPDDDWLGDMQGIVFKPGERPTAPTIEVIREARRRAGLPIHTVNPWAKQGTDTTLVEAQAAVRLGATSQGLFGNNLGVDSDDLARALSAQTGHSN